MSQGTGVAPAQSKATGVANDVDSHEFIPQHMWPELFGHGGELGMQIDLLGASNGARNSLVRPDIVADDADIDPVGVWKAKGPDAPSAIDLTRRPAVLDAMGIDRQLVFASFGLFGIRAMIDPTCVHWLGNATAAERYAMGKEMIDGHNRWAASITKDVGDRVRPVAMIWPETVDQMVADLQGMLDSGIRAVQLPAGVPPADTSPGDRALDPFWALAAEANCPITLHIGTELALFASQQWSANVPEFVPSGQSSHEFPIEPYRASILHYCLENFLQTMVLSGVFERHPTLRIGCVEGCAHWIGPLAERMDIWAGEFTRRLANTLTMLPSEYLDRNVRVTPFCFEPIEVYLERYPGLSHVYCYSSDYPHVEGGEDSKQKLADRLASMGEDVRRRFFYDNAELLLPA